MTAKLFFKHSKSKSLTAQIRDAQRQILNRQQRVDICTARLVGGIQQQMTAPTTLLLAGCMGFILGEITKHPPPSSRGAVGKPRTTETSPLITALNLMISAHMLYTALPLAWLMKTFNQPKASDQTPERNFHSGAVTSIQPVMDEGQNNS